MTTHTRRIALVSAFPPGQRSLNEYGLHFARALAAQPDVSEVVVLADRLDRTMPELDLGPKIRVRRVWSFNSIATPMRLLRALWSERPDAVIWNLQTASFGDRELSAALGLLAPALARLAGWRSGIIAHNIVAGIDLEATTLKGQRARQAVVRLGGAAITRAMCAASYMTVTLRSYADILTRQVPRADITLVPHGTFDTGRRAWVPLAARPMRIVTMGKFGTYKRLETLLAAFDRLRAMPGVPPLQLVIGGTDHPNTPGYVGELARGRKDDQGVSFAGYVAEEDVPAFFEGGRLAVFDYEATTGSSGVLHQAASLGAVPVFPRIGDFVDLCDDEGLTGGHFTPGDADALARAMRDLLADTAEAERIARANRRAVEAIPMADIAAWHVAKLFEAPADVPSFV
ncbi:glycosyltransferase [Roseibacterium sp. SDUM158016]|uniref:glycosyltransferase n=1 Tax=Roseicyclus sediminis TaxID=2980997 RepID=UPI0021D11117|nr:glycosyltransferase [Roseibacterium sp. SDUM158016]MCU4655221.1 glycosyltransferase [Roseibacterium sp. SDUM158016]